MSLKTELEDALAEQLKEHNISYSKQVYCIPGRRYRADFIVKSWGKVLAVEVDGGVWQGHNKAKFGKGSQQAGGHQTGYGKEGDCTRECDFLMRGIPTLRVTKLQIKNGHALKAIQAWNRH